VGPCARRAPAGYYPRPPDTRRRALRTRPILASILATALAGCAAGAAPQISRGSGADCVVLFQNYDAAAATMSTPSGRRDRMPIPPALQIPVLRLQQADCLTLSDDLAPMATAGGLATIPGGAAIRPTSVHAGVVTNMGDDAAVRAFFEQDGVRARSVGAAGLGRRIYIGPFATQGELDAARDLAVRAGFASPYPADF
jgi:hypothetical protein